MALGRVRREGGLCSRGLGWPWPWTGGHTLRSRVESAGCPPPTTPPNLPHPCSTPSILVPPNPVPTSNPQGLGPPARSPAPPPARPVSKSTSLAPHAREHTSLSIKPRPSSLRHPIKLLYVSGLSSSLSFAPVCLLLFHPGLGVAATRAASTAPPGTRPEPGCTRLAWPPQLAGRR